ncbi:hypothetical protein [Kribbella sp.]|uniref:hypothetical protein n=1 Tax=Kribbella sp. TaxID=1871183 RepID=UPI002D47084F|nr:hypothetical protein [Kribbella sp.]HZX07203.1 hypothetical protein [Kribbella sp.]
MSAPKRRCKGRLKTGELCGSGAPGYSNYCGAHRPEDEEYVEPPPDDRGERELQKTYGWCVGPEPQQPRTVPLVQPDTEPPRFTEGVRDGVPVPIEPVRYRRQEDRGEST